VDAKIEPVVEVTVYGGIIDNGAKKNGSRRKEWGKFQTTVTRKISEGIR
jgi:hypothetical protein